jgi:glutathione synthase/RimK-type ligase-like ATP-grasp enzyme
MKIKNGFVNRLKSRISFGLRPGRTIIYDDDKNLNDAKEILLDSTVQVGRNVNVGLIKDSDRKPYYTKFEKFLKNNKIPYEYFDIHSSSWVEDARKLDMIIWRPMSSPWEIEEAREKIYFLERYCNKLVYPSFAEIMFYEKKILQYYILKNEGFPVIGTFISHDYDEVLRWIEKTQYPFVSKINTGAGSQGVSLVKNKNQAKRLTENIFRAGEATYWPFLKQKNYVFFQNYMENKGFDLRVTVIDENNIFGYFRKIPAGDFRASGMNLILKKELPREPIKTALDITKRLNFTNLSVDFLQSVKDDKFYIIEASNFIKIETDEQLKVNGIPGKYQYVKETDNLTFEEGKYWIQELILKRFFEKHFSRIHPPPLRVEQ